MPHPRVYSDIPPDLLAAIETQVGRAREAFETRWPLWKQLNGHPAGRTASDGTCVVSSVALRMLLMDAVPDFRWNLAGGRPTWRTPLGGYRDRHGAAHPHIWVMGVARNRRVLVDITEDQFDGREDARATVLEGAAIETSPYRGNATRALLRHYADHERLSAGWLLETLRELPVPAPNWSRSRSS